MKIAPLALLAAFAALSTSLAPHAASAKAIDSTRGTVGLWPPKTADIFTGTSPVPSVDEWNAAPEVGVTKSTAYHCETKLVREWFRSSCVAYGKWTLLAAKSISTPPGTQAFYWTDPGGQKASVVTNLRAGKRYVYRFAWNPGNVTSDLTIDLTGPTPVAGFNP